MRGSATSVGVQGARGGAGFLASGGAAGVSETQHGSHGARWRMWTSGSQQCALCAPGHCYTHPHQTRGCAPSPLRRVAGVAGGPATEGGACLTCGLLRRGLQEMISCTRVRPQASHACVRACKRVRAHSAAATRSLPWQAPIKVKRPGTLRVGGAQAHKRVAARTHRPPPTTQGGCLPRYPH